jgi:hypothetical protein
MHTKPFLNNKKATACNPQSVLIIFWGGKNITTLNTTNQLALQWVHSVTETETITFHFFHIHASKA